MTAKEIKECAAVYMDGGKNEPPILWRYQFKEYEFKEFCEQLCKEQRKLCSQISALRIEQPGDILQINRSEILNAEMPEL